MGPRGISHQIMTVLFFCKFQAYKSAGGFAVRGVLPIGSSAFEAQLLVHRYGKVDVFFLQSRATASTLGSLSEEPSSGSFASRLLRK